jgi:hypothetical protein
MSRRHFNVGRRQVSDRGVSRADKQQLIALLTIENEMLRKMAAELSQQIAMLRQSLRRTSPEGATHIECSETSQAPGCQTIALSSSLGLTLRRRSLLATRVRTPTILRKRRDRRGS